MEEKKRKQHYVFQAYLSSWAVNQQIWCYRNENIFISNTLNVAQERDFYRIQPINSDELKFLHMFYEKSHPKVFKAVLDHINAYLKPLEWQMQIETFESLCKQTIPEGSPLSSEIEKDFNLLKKKVDIDINNMMEDYLGDIEGESIAWMKSLKENDSTFYYSSDDEKAKTQGYYDDERFYFLYFISVQYFRTKAIKERWISNFEPALNHPQWNSLDIPKENIRLENLQPLFMWEFQNACAYTLRKTNAHLTILINNTQIPFITTDQPVINLKADYENIEATTTDLLFYYPLSPQIAITINDLNNENTLFLSQQEVDNYNRSMIKASYENIFSNSKEIIEGYVQN